MKITKIELKNFRAFYGNYLIDLGKGKNLLVYGENGSGKSSLYHALKEFLSGQGRSLEPCNVFAQEDGFDSFIKLSVATKPGSPPDELTWSTPGNSLGTAHNDTDQLYIRDAAKTSGFLEYKTLLETYFLPIENDQVNIFKLLLMFFGYKKNIRTGRTLQEDWRSINFLLNKRYTRNIISQLSNHISSFNGNLFDLISAFKSKTRDILNYFNYKIRIEFIFTGISIERWPFKHIENSLITIKVKYYDKDIPRHHVFLNEAKLSALALSIYFAALLQTPHDQNKLNLLVLDDVLIGLDMSNRLPMLDILRDFFKDYQIFFLTYDRTWYEMVKTRLKDSEWKSIEFFSSHKRDDQGNPLFELPLYADNQSYLERSKQYFDAHDYRGAVMYCRTAFETMLKGFCEKRNLKLRYRVEPQYTAGELWDAVKGEKTDDSKEKFVDDALAEDVTICLRYFLNNLSHANIVNVSRKEVQEVLQTMEKLEVILEAAPEKPREKPKTKTK